MGLSRYGQEPQRIAQNCPTRHNLPPVRPKGTRVAGIASVWARIGDCGLLRGTPFFSCQKVARGVEKEASPGKVKVLRRGGEQIKEGLCSGNS